MTLTTQEAQAMKAEVAIINAATDELDNLIDAASGGTPPPTGTPPVASFTFASPGDPNYPRKLTFTASPPSMASYAWDWGDGRTETTTNNVNNNTWGVDGTYTVTLVVTDANGLSGTTSQSVVVDFDPDTPPPNPHPGVEIRAELPRFQVDVSLPDQNGETIHVPIGGDLQAALWNAKPGDTVTIANGGHWTGNFTLPNYGAGAGWIVVRPDNMQYVPKPGRRITAADAAAAGLPVLHSPNNQGALQTIAGAHHYRFIGLEIMPTDTIYNGGLCRIGAAETKLSDLPHHFIFDRVFVHGIAGQSARRGIVLNCGEAAVIDSALTEIHEQGADSQSIGGWNGAGPWLIENNLLEAASENIIFGGGDPSIAGLVACDVTIRRNYFTKNPAWLAEGGWNVKLLLEMKAVIRCLMECNVMEYCWRDGQGGSAINLKSVNQGGTCPDCGCEDLTFRLNVVHHVGSGIMLTGNDVGATRLMTRTTIEHNVLFGINTVAEFEGDGRGFLINNNPKDVLIAHNSIFGCTNTAITFGGPMGPTDPQPEGLRFRDNIIDAGEYGIKGPGMGTKDTLAMIPDLFMAGNVVVGSQYAVDVDDLPPGNYVAPTRAAVGFASDYSLLPSSPYKGKGTDGTDPGADMARVRAAVAGVMGPAPAIADFAR